MKTHKKRLLSLLLLVCMICTMQAGMSLTAFAVGETFTPSGTIHHISPAVTFDKDGYATITDVPVIPGEYSEYKLMYVVDFGDCESYTDLADVQKTFGTTTPLGGEWSSWYIDDNNYAARGTYSEGSKIDIRSGSKSLLLTVVHYEVYGNVPGDQPWIYGAYLCAIPQKITYDLNGGNIGGDTAAKTEYLLNGDTLATTFNAPTKGSSLFKGWYTAGTGGSKVTSATASSAIYYAQWEDKLPITNTAGTATVAYGGTEIDLTAVSGLFTVDAGAGPQTFTIEGGGTGAGTISGNLLTVTEAGTIGIGLTTAETATHQAGAKITATITVNKGSQDAPAGLGKTDAGSYGGNDGKITGLTPSRLYEYKKDGGAYTAVTADTSGEITGLSAGAYVVRFAGNDLYDAGSDSPEIIIGQAAPPSSAKDVTGMTSPGNATINGTAITVSVANSVTSQTVSLTVSADATWNLYSDAACTQENAAKIMSLTVGANTAYVKVTAADGTTQVYLLTITRASSSSNKSSSGSGGSKIIPSSLPAATVTGTTQNKAATNGQGNASTTVTDKNITDAIANAKAEAAKKGVSAGDITVSINISTSSDVNMITVNLPMTTQQQVISNKLTGVELAIDRPDIVIGLNNAAITEINRQANADVQLAAARTDSTKLSTAAKNAIGSRPAYDFKASYQGGKGSVTDFGKGSVYVRIPYTPAKNEKTGYLYAAYVDSNGKVIRVPGSAYDANTKSLNFTTNHFSVYGIGYDDPTVQFTDVSSHWAKDSIDYVVGRGLLNGISQTSFAPNTAMTRGMLVTALGRLAGADTKSYTANSFTDVKADSTLRPYIEWAYKKGIVQGIGSQQFAPDRAVTREEIAVILVNYFETTGYTLPKIREATAYADAASISSTYKAAVSSLQQAGVMMGGEGNKFNPKSSATRGEVSAILHRAISN